MSLSPLSAGVLGAATLVSSPALWYGLVDRSLPLDVALTRYLIAVGLCWALLSVVTAWAFPEPGSVRLPSPQGDGKLDAAADALEDTAGSADVA